MGRAANTAGSISNGVILGQGRNNRFLEVGLSWRAADESSSVVEGLGGGDPQRAGVGVAVGGLALERTPQNSGIVGSATVGRELESAVHLSGLSDLSDHIHDTVRLSLAQLVIMVLIR